MSFEQDDLLNDLRLEALDGLQKAEEELLSLEDGNLDAINSVFRVVHSIKGNTSFFDLFTLNKFAHRLENLLDDIRNGKCEVERDVIDLLLDGIDRMRTMVNSEDFGESADVADMLATIDGFMGGGARPITAAIKPEAEATPAAAVPTEPAPTSTGVAASEFSAHGSLSTPSRSTRAVYASTTMRLGQFLLHQDYINHDQLLRAMIEQQRNTPSQLSVLSSFGGLSVGECLAVTEHAQDHNSSCFTSAVALGLLDVQDIEQLHKKTESMRPSIGQTLVELGEVQASDVRTWLREFFAVSRQQEGHAA